MSLVDPISDMLTRIRNAYAVEKETVCVSGSKLKEAVLEILKANGYVEDFQKEGNEVCITLKYEDSKPAAECIERVSKPGRRIYVKKDEIPTVLSGRGITVISTSKGIMTGDDAKKENLGGELICKVY
jgi:small subunit ribosomal protein S8